MHSHSFEHNGSLKFVLSGRITDQDHDSFHALIKGVETSTARRIELDLTAAEFVDSAGLGMLLLVRDAAAAKQADIVLAGAQGQVRRLIVSNRFGELFTLAP